MSTKLLLLLSVFLLSPTASEEGVKLRVSTLGYEDAQERAGDRKETILRSIETLIIPGKKFSASCRHGAEIIELSGSATQDKESNLKIRIHYKYIKIPAEIMEAIRRKGGELPKFLRGSSIQTTATFKPGDALILGGVRSVKENKTEGSKKFSAYRIVATLVHRDAVKQKTPEQGDQPKSR